MTIQRKNALRRAALAARSNAGDDGVLMRAAGQRPRAARGGLTAVESLEPRRLFSTATFGSDVAMAVPASGTGDLAGSPANPYPSTIDVSGMDGSISHVSVTLLGVSHVYPQDMDILLVGPSGRRVMLMSDAGNQPSNNVNLTFDDSAANQLDVFGPLVSGTYQPTNYNLGDQFPAPVVSDDGWAVQLATFDGTVANGTWQLYVSDDSPGDTGSIAGWSLTITSDTTPPAVQAATLLYQQRPQELRFHFSKDVESSLAAGNGAVVIENVDTGEILPPDTYDYTYDTRSNTAMFSLADPAIQLPDGNYRVLIRAAQVFDDAGLPLDGNADGTGGDDFVFDFFWLAGDANHDRTVDTLDFNALAANFGLDHRQYQNADFNYDGIVDTLDFNVLASQFGKSVPPPPIIQPGRAAPAVAGGTSPFACSTISSPASNTLVDDLPRDSAA